MACSQGYAAEVKTRQLRGDESRMVMMVGDQLRVQRQGPYGNEVLAWFGVNKGHLPP